MSRNKNSTHPVIAAFQSVLSNTNQTPQHRSSSGVESDYQYTSTKAFLEKVMLIETNHRGTIYPLALTDGLFSQQFLFKIEPKNLTPQTEGKGVIKTPNSIFLGGKDDTSCVRLNNVYIEATYNI